jgi:hypothetical protein
MIQISRRILAEIIQRQNEAKKTQKNDRFYASEKGQKNAQNSPFLTVLALLDVFDYLLNGVFFELLLAVFSRHVNKCRFYLSIC